MGNTCLKAIDNVYAWADNEPYDPTNYAYEENDTPNPKQYNIYVQYQMARTADGEKTWQDYDKYVGYFRIPRYKKRQGGTSNVNTCPRTVKLALYAANAANVAPLRSFSLELRSLTFTALDKKAPASVKPVDVKIGTDYQKLGPADNEHTFPYVADVKIPNQTATDKWGLSANLVNQLIGKNQEQQVGGKKHHSYTKTAEKVKIHGAVRIVYACRGHKYIRMNGEYMPCGQVKKKFGVTL